jgi:hypothetical protein
LLAHLPPEFDYVSLQFQPSASEQATLAQHQVIDPAADIVDFSDTAAICAQLDLVISVDTSVAHLAGALNKPLWVLLPYCPDWRWLILGGAKSGSVFHVDPNGTSAWNACLEGRKKSLYNTIASALLPVMRDFTDALLDSGSMTERLNDTAKQLKQDNVIETWAREGMRAVAAFSQLGFGVATTGPISTSTTRRISPSITQQALAGFRGQGLVADLEI